MSTLNETSLKVTWRNPQQPQAGLTCKVVYQGDGGRPANSVDASSAPGPAEVTLNDLEPAVTYHVTVTFNGPSGPVTTPGQVDAGQGAPGGIGEC